MAKVTLPKYYSPFEEKINVISHAIGFILSFVALVFLVVRAGMYGNSMHVVSFTIFGVSLMVLYAASSLYHNAKQPEVRKRLKIFDHASIYVLIAGTYTPFTLVTLHGVTGWIIFGISWGIALVGITLKLFFTGRYSIASTVCMCLWGGLLFLPLSRLFIICRKMAFSGFSWAD